jgi:hypothetical protein
MAQIASCGCYVEIFHWTLLFRNDTSKCQAWIGYRRVTGRPAKLEMAYFPTGANAANQGSQGKTDAVSAADQDL